MSQPTTYQGRLLFGDEADAVAYWKDKEWKKWAVDVTAGPPRGARFIARLAGPRELGCVPTPEKGNHPPARSA